MISRNRTGTIAGFRLAADIDAMPRDRIERVEII
jgi:hypothetical protein